MHMNQVELKLSNICVNHTIKFHSIQKFIILVITKIKPHSGHEKRYKITTSHSYFQVPVHYIRSVVTFSVIITADKTIITFRLI